MATALIIVGILLIIAAFYASSMELFGIDVLFAILGTFICCVGLVKSEDRNSVPTALDVYRGNTTLEITYRDSIPVDTIVIFKNNN